MFRKKLVFILNILPTLYISLYSLFFMYDCINTTKLIRYNKAVIDISRGTNSIVETIRIEGVKDTVVSRGIIETLTIKNKEKLYDIYYNGDTNLTLKTATKEHNLYRNDLVPNIKDATIKIDGKELKFKDNELICSVYLDDNNFKVEYRGSITKEKDTLYNLNLKEKKDNRYTFELYNTYTVPATTEYVTTNTDLKDGIYYDERLNVLVLDTDNLVIKFILNTKVLYVIFAMLIYMVAIARLGVLGFFEYDGTKLKQNLAFIVFLTLSTISMLVYNS